MLYRRANDNLNGAFWNNLLNAGTGYFAASEARSLARTTEAQSRFISTQAATRRPGLSTPVILGVVGVGAVLLYLAFRR